jgi:hypothetical protein
MYVVLAIGLNDFLLKVNQFNSNEVESIEGLFTLIIHFNLYRLTSIKIKL